MHRWHLEECISSGSLVLASTRTEWQQIQHIRNCCIFDLRLKIKDLNENSITITFTSRPKMHIMCSTTSELQFLKIWFLRNEVQQLYSHFIQSCARRTVGLAIWRANVPKLCQIDFLPLNRGSLCMHLCMHLSIYACFMLHASSVRHA